MRYDVYVPGSGYHFRSVPLEQAATHKVHLHKCGVYCVYIYEAGTFSTVGIW